MAITRFSHVAYRCLNARDTVDFYSKLLGLKYEFAVSANRVASTNEYSPHIHIFLEVSPGSYLAFFELAEAGEFKFDEGIPRWVQHIAMSVDTEEEVHEYKEKLEAAGVPVLGVTDHGIFQSIYFFDPSGHRLEITCQTMSEQTKRDMHAISESFLDEWDRTKRAPEIGRTALTSSGQSQYSSEPGKVMAEGIKINPPFRADHVGSLLRPEKLRAARERLEGNHHQRVRESRHFPELEALENEAIIDAIRFQELVGLKAITDGEFRRRSWWQDFVLELDGTFIDFAEFAIDFTDPAGNKLPAPVAHVDGKIKRVRGFNTASYQFLRSHTDQTPKVTMPSPPVVHFFGGRLAIDARVYPDLDEMWADLARAYREEIQDLGRLGCNYIQIDECIFALMCDPKFRAQLVTRGDNPKQLLETYANVINESVRARPADMTLAMHLCRGNNRGHWLGEGGYDYISDVLFNRTNVDAFFMEYDSPRAGDFAPLKFLPKGKVAVLGLISSKTPRLESADDIKRRIEEASHYAPIEQLALSPQCGFASHFMGNPLTLDDQRRKLEIVMQIAAEVWTNSESL